MSEIKGSMENKILFEALKRPFAPPTLEPNPYGYIRLHNKIPLTAHYFKAEAGMGFPIPRTPIFHPYNPLGNEVPATAPAANRYQGGVPATTISLQLPAEARKFLPEALKKTLESMAVAPDKLDIYFVTQNMPWDPRYDPLLIRPHYWVHGDPSLDASVKAGTFNDTPLCDIGIFSNNPAISIADPANPANQKRNEIAGKFGVSSHSHGEPLLDDVTKNPVLDQNKQIVINPKTLHTLCSPDGHAGGLMTGIDYNLSQSLYSIVRKPDGRIAVTLHWLLNPADQVALTRISKRNNDVVDASIIKLIAEQPFSLLDVMAEIEKLGKTSQLNAPNGPMSDLKQLMGVAGMSMVDTYAAEMKAEKSAATIASAPKSVTPTAVPIAAVPIGTATPAKTPAPAGSETKSLAEANHGEDMDLTLALSASTAAEDAKRRSLAEQQEKEELELAKATSLSLSQHKPELKQTQDLEFQKQLEAARTASIETKQAEEKKIAAAAVTGTSTVPGMIAVLTELNTRMIANLEAMTQVAEKLENFEGILGDATSRAHAKLSEAVDRAEALGTRLLEASELEMQGKTLSPEELKSRMEKFNSFKETTLAAVENYANFVKRMQEYLESEKALKALLTEGAEGGKQPEGPKAEGAKEAGPKGGSKRFV